VSDTHTLTLQRAGGKPFEVEVDFLISAAGPLSTPILPNIPGLDTYEGTQFHCYNWDESVELDGKRIGVVGNGSSGVQMIVSRPQGRRLGLPHADLKDKFVAAWPERDCGGEGDAVYSVRRLLPSEE
jgi:hypothetical protein